jgi:hypothetical protein
MAAVVYLNGPAVAVRRSSFGGVWAWPLSPVGEDALFRFFCEPPAPIPPLGGKPAYIVEPYAAGDLAEHLQELGVEWEVQ